MIPIHCDPITLENRMIFDFFVLGFSISPIPPVKGGRNYRHRWLQPCPERCSSLRSCSAFGGVRNQTRNGISVLDKVLDKVSEVIPWDGCDIFSIAMRIFYDTVTDMFHFHLFPTSGIRKRRWRPQPSPMTGCERWRSRGGSA
jgi:hypothetical protein